MSCHVLQNLFFLVHVEISWSAGELEIEFVRWSVQLKVGYLASIKLSSVLSCEDEC